MNRNNSSFITHHSSLKSANWLMTSVGAKVDLVRRLRAALSPHGLRLFACDISPDSAALHFCDGGFLVPPSTDPAYLDFLVAACRERGIGVILPTRDEDLLGLARARVTLTAAGIEVLVSPLESLEICLDKIRFHEHCLAHGLPVLPRVTQPSPESFPLFARPRRGAGGSAAQVVSNPAMLYALYGEPPWPDLLLQSLCAAPEYSIDALFDEDGRALQWIARERLRVRAGESTVSRTVALPDLDRLMTALAQSLHLFGAVTVQTFWSPADGARLIEVNPRFGGASALGIEAGLDTPRRLVAWAQGELGEFVRPRPLRYGLKMLRYSQDLFCEG